MAELFYRQGHLRRALAIYREVARTSPNDEVSRRLAELEAEDKKQQGERMSFREHMQRIVEQTPGAIACTVMGFDGIAIDSFEVGGGELDLPALVVEYSAAAKQLRRAAAEQAPGGGDLVEMGVTVENLSLLLRPLTDEYFLAVVLKVDGLAGKARYLMRVTAPAIAKELA